MLGVVASSLHTESQEGPPHLLGTPNVTNLTKQNT